MMPRKAYGSISLPEDIIEEIDEFRENSDWHDSRPDVVKDALKEFFERHRDE